MIDINNLNILLTGATGGIGNSILEKLVSGGANVLACGTNDKKLNLIKDNYSNVKVQTIANREVKYKDMDLNQHLLRIHVTIVRIGRIFKYKEYKIDRGGIK